MSKPTGGPAFPVPGLQHDDDFNGMTLRDYFAAKALSAVTKNLRDEVSTYGERVACDVVASLAYQMADAMIAARVKP